MVKKNGNATRNISNNGSSNRSKRFSTIFSRKIKKKQDNDYWWFDLWKKKRQKGRWRYILLENGLLWGLLLSVGMALLTHFSDNGFTFPPFNNPDWLRMLLQRFVFFSAFGAVFGAVKWWLNEKRYKKRYPESC